MLLRARVPPDLTFLLEKLLVVHRCGRERAGTNRENGKENGNGVKRILRTGAGGDIYLLEKGGRFLWGNVRVLVPRILCANRLTESGYTASERANGRENEREKESTASSSSSSRFYIRPFLLSFSFHPVHISDVKRRFATADRTPRCNQ